MGTSKAWTGGSLYGHVLWSSLQTVVVAAGVTSREREGHSLSLSLFLY